MRHMVERMGGIMRKTSLVITLGLFFLGLSVLAGNAIAQDGLYPIECFISGQTRVIVDVDGNPPVLEPGDSEISLSM